MKKELKFTLLALPAILFTVRVWLWVFGLVAPLSENQGLAGVGMAVVNYYIAGMMVFP